MEKGEIDGYLLKPMNCPMHIQIFASEPRSYRDLPCGWPSSAPSIAGRSPASSAA